jgi:WD40-like Beta Propeller Repeat
VLFFAGAHLRKITLADSKVRDLAETASAAGATWLSDGSILFAPQPAGGIRRLHDGRITDATTLRPGDRAHVFPFSTGVANDFVYTAVGENGRRTVRLVQEGEERELSVTTGHGQIVGGYLLVVRDDVLLAHRMEESGAPGRSRPLVTGVGVTAAGRNLFVASPRMILSARSNPRARVLTWFDMNGTEAGTIGEPGDLWQVRLSPDARLAAVTHVAPLLRTLDISIVPVASGKPTQPLTLALAADSDPVWAPNGRRVMFKSLQTGRPALFTRRVDDRDAEDESFLEGDATPTDWRDSSVLVHAIDAASGSDIVAIDEMRHTRQTLVKSGFNDTEGRWSPDRAWLAYVSDESGRPDIYASRREGGRVRVSFAGGTRPRWSRDGRSLFFLRGSTIMRATQASDSPASFVPAVPVVDIPGIRDFDVAHQRDALLALVPVGSSSAVPISVIVDWRSVVQ